MLSVLSGFATIWIVIGTGWVLGRIGVLDDRKQLVLNSLAFSVATPCLLFLLMARADLRHGFATNMLVNVMATVVAAVTYVAVALLRFRRPGGDTVIGAFLASYVNAANLGLPIAAYVLHDMSWMAPVLLFQLLVLQPLGVTVLDVLELRSRPRTGSRWRAVILPLRNPLTAGTALGLVANLVHLRLPTIVADPIGLIGQMAVPMMLISFGVSLHAHGLPGRGPDTALTWVSTFIKLVWQPLAAFGLARYAFHLPPATVLACVVIGGLPSAQNIFVIAQRYRAGVGLARDGTFLTTVLSVPTLMVATLLVGH